MKSTTFLASGSQMQQGGTAGAGQHPFALKRAGSNLNFSFLAMGRSCTVDQSLQAHAEARVQARADAEVGALVGRCAVGKDLVLQAIRAPERDGVAPLTMVAGGSGSSASGKKGGSGSKAGKLQGGSTALQLDDEWVVEHAAMVERLLPGGLDVVGLYVLCPSAAFAAAAAQLAALAGAAAKELSGGLPSLLVLHMDSVTGALTLREAGAGALRPCELKLAGVVDQMVHLQSRYALDLELPVTNTKQELQAAFQAATDAAAQRLRGALGLLGGQLAGADSQLADLLPAAGSGSGAAPASVELLLQPASSLAFCTASGGKAGSGLQHGRTESSILGTVALQGVLDCRTYVHRREAAAAAVDALRADIQRSLQARMDALLDAAEQQQEAAAAEHEQQQRGGGGGVAAAAPPQHPLFVPAGEAGKPLSVSLPRRAFVTAAAAGGVPYCDYLFEGESSQAMLSRLQMLLPMPELASAAVECQETAAAAVPARTAARRRCSTEVRGGGSGAAFLPCTLVTAASVAVAALALGVGYLSLAGSGQ